MKDLVVEAKINSTKSRKKEAQIHTIIHKPQQVLEKKERQSVTCTKTKKSNFPKPSPCPWKITKHNRSTHKKQSNE